MYDRSPSPLSRQVPAILGVAVLAALGCLVLVDQQREAQTSQPEPVLAHDLTSRGGRDPDLPPPAKVVTPPETLPGVRQDVNTNRASDRPVFAGPHDGTHLYGGGRCKACVLRPLVY